MLREHYVMNTGDLVLIKKIKNLGGWYLLLVIGQKQTTIQLDF